MGILHPAAHRFAPLLTVIALAMPLLAFDGRAALGQTQPAEPEETAVRAAIKETLSLDAGPGQPVRAGSSTQQPNQALTQVTVTLLPSTAQARALIDTILRNPINAPPARSATFAVPGSGDGAVYTIYVERPRFNEGTGKATYNCGRLQVELARSVTGKEQPQRRGADSKTEAEALANRAQQEAVSQAQALASSLRAKGACTDAPGTATPGKYDLSVRTIEVVQTLQDEAGGIPLIARKATAVRVYVKLGDGPLAPLAGVTARLHGYRDGKEMQDSPLEKPANGSITAPNVPQRGDTGHSLNFRLPPDWTNDGKLMLRAEVMSQKDDANAKNNDHSVEVTFLKGKRIYIDYFRVCYRTEANCPQASPQVMQQMKEFVLKTYPVGEDDLIWARAPIDKWVWDRSDLSKAEGYNAFLATVRQRHMLLSRDDPGNQGYLVAWLPGDDNGISVAGLGYQPGNEVFVKDYSALGPDGIFSSQRGLAHELGHNFGLTHTKRNEAECSGGNEQGLDWPYADAKTHEVGFDPVSMQVVPATAYDFMSACPSKLQIWISNHHYRKLLGGPLNPKAAHDASGFSADDLFASAAPHRLRLPVQAPAATAEPAEYLVVTGSARRDGSGGRIGATYHVTTTAPPEPPVARGNHCLRLAASGTTAADYCFNLAFLDHWTGKALDEEYFTFRVALPPGAAKLSLMRGNKELTALTASKSAPAVTITSPTRGSTWSGAGTVAWSATDADGDTLTYAVQYSPDAGKTWYPLAVDVQEPRLAVDTTALAPGREVLLRVLATDGLNTTTEQVGPFTIAAQRDAGSGTPASLIGLGAAAAVALAGGGVWLLRSRHRAGRSVREGVLSPFPAEQLRRTQPEAQTAPPAPQALTGPPHPSPPVPPAWRLLVAQGYASALALDLDRPLITIGRDDTNLLQLFDPSASARHARLLWVEQHWLLVDVGSDNGTYVNDERVSRRVVGPGDRLRLGATLLVVQGPWA
jgi:hypothetical protein